MDDEVDASEFRGFIFDFHTGVGIAGATVCPYQRDDLPCATTAGDGSYAIVGMPLGFEGALDVTAQDHLGALVWGRFPEEAAVENHVGLLARETGVLFGDALETTLDPALGHIAVASGDREGRLIPGIVYGIAPVSGIGPAYTNEHGLPDLSLMGTGPSSVGGWANANLGEVDITATLPNGTPCTPGDRMIPGTAPGSARLVVDADRFASPASVFVCG